MVAPEMISTYIIQKSLQVRMNLLLRGTSIGIEISIRQSGYSPPGRAVCPGQSCHM